MVFLYQEEAYIARVKELEEVTEYRNQKRKEHDDLRKQRLDEFMMGFGVITTKLKEMYQVCMRVSPNPDQCVVTCKGERTLIVPAVYLAAWKSG